VVAVPRPVRRRLHALRFTPARQAALAPNTNAPVMDRGAVVPGATTHWTVARFIVRSAVAAHSPDDEAYLGQPASSETRRALPHPSGWSTWQNVPSAGGMAHIKNSAGSHPFSHVTAHGRARASFQAGAPLPD